MTAECGEDALCILRKKPHPVNLVLTGINLPDMCSFEFIRLVDKEMNIPVVMICETSNEATISRGLLSGAMYCLVKPLCLHDIQDLWQFHIVKQRDVMQCNGLRMAGIRQKEPFVPLLETCGSSQGQNLLHERGGISLGQNVLPERGDSSQGPKKRKRDELEIPGGCFVRPSSPFAWTPVLRNTFLGVIQDLGLFEAAPEEVVRLMGTPQLSTGLVAEELEYLRFHFWEQMTDVNMESLLGVTSVVNQNSHLMSPGAESSSQGVTSAFKQNSPFITGESMSPGVESSYKPLHTQEKDSPLTPYLQDPVCRLKLKNIVKGALVKWKARARAIESIIESALADAYAPPGLRVPPKLVEADGMEDLDVEEVWDAILELI